MEEFDKDDTLGRWLGGTLSPAEEEALRKRPDFDEYERLVNGLEQFAPGSYQTNEQLARLKARRNEQAKTGADAGAKVVKRAKVRRLPWLAAAASVLLLLTAWFFWPAGDTQYLAAAGTTETADLPDGSNVRINAGSSLNYEAGDNARIARLEGEAFFEVEKDGRTFSVETPNGKVTVLGTSFNVYSRGEDMRVSCRTGKVKVNFGDRRAEYVLTPGQSVAISDTAVVETTIAANEALDWLDNRSVFNARPLGEVLDELERQFALTIETPAGFNRTRTISTTFPHGDADRALEIALGTLDGVTYQRDGKRVLIK